MIQRLIDFLNVSPVNFLAIKTLKEELEKILHGPERQRMMEGYREVRERLGSEKAPENAARIMTGLLCDAARSPQS